MIDVAGSVAAHTGTRNAPTASHHVGRRYAVQANAMRNDRAGQRWPPRWKRPRVTSVVSRSYEP